MSFKSLLNNTCDIYERTYSEDKNGQRIPKDDMVLSGVKCRFFDKSQSFSSNARFQTVSFNERIYIMRPNFSIQQGMHYFVVSGKKYEIQDIKDLGGTRSGRMSISLSLSE